MRQVQEAELFASSEQQRGDERRADRGADLSYRRRRSLVLLVVGVVANP